MAYSTLIKNISFSFNSALQKKGGKSLNAGGGKSGGVDTRAYDGYDDMEDLM